MSNIKLFEHQKVRTHWDMKEEKWYFSITDVVAILTDSVNPLAYWRKLKERLKKEGNETVTNCHGLKMTAADGKMRMTDVADTEQLLRLIQSIPSHCKAIVQVNSSHGFTRVLSLLFCWLLPPYTNIFPVVFLFKEDK
jgi:hypothetical protein